MHNTPNHFVADDLLQGIHHITAVSGDPARNARFYRDVLGLRLVKKTVNFDDPQTYHLYFGDTVGSPGTILTFFPWPGARPGRLGAGMIETISFSIPRGSRSFWQQRLTANGVVIVEQPPRFDESSLPFTDPDGMRLALVESDRASPRAWSATVATGQAITGFHAATERVHAFDSTDEFLKKHLGFRCVAEDYDVRRYRTGGDGVGFYDLRVDPNAPPAMGGRGTVHHIAWMTPDLAASERWRDRLVGRGNAVSPVMDRKYFRSIYFRGPAGVLFELATNGPGFAIDENPESLGSGLMLPEQFEAQRKSIESNLPALEA